MIWSQIRFRAFQDKRLFVEITYGRLFVRGNTYSWILQSCENVSPVSWHCDTENRSMETISRAEKYLGGAPTGSSPFPRPLTNFNPIFSSRRSAFRPSCTRQLAQQPLSASVNILLPTYTAAAAAVSCLLSSDQAVPQVSTRVFFSADHFGIKTIEYS